MASGAIEQVYWDHVTEHQYRKMQNRHPALWQFVHDFIEFHQVQSVLEVGCGLVPPAKGWVKQYQGVDRNGYTDALHDDFLLLHTKPYHGWDLLLAAGVIEHCPGGFPIFLNKALSVETKRILISFFLGVDQEESRKEQDARGFWKNWYCRQEIEKWLKERGVKHDWVTLGPRDTVLVIEGE